MNKNALPIILTTLALTACGGGGSDSASTESTSAPAAKAVAARAQFDAGVFFFAGAGSTVNGVDQSHIGKTANGSVDTVSGNTIAVTSLYAGAGSTLTTSLGEFLRFKKMGKSGWSSRGDNLQFAYGTGNPVMLVPRLPNNELAEQVKWELSVSEQDVAGTSIDKYLQSLRTASKTPTVAGNFAPGSKSLILKYTAQNDLLVAPHSSTELKGADLKPVTAMTSLINLTTCVRSADGKQLLVMQFTADGKINLYESEASPATEQCTAIPPASASIAAAQYAKKPYGAHTFLDITFLDDFDYTRYFPMLGNKEGRDPGVKVAIAQPVNDNWVFAYFIPKGATLTDPVKYMNQASADGVKGALNLR